MVGQVIGNDTVVLRYGWVSKEIAPLVIMSTCGMLAKDRYAVAILQVEDLIRLSLHLNINIVTGHGGYLLHCISPSLCCCRGHIRQFSHESKRSPHSIVVLH